MTAAVGVLTLIWSLELKPADTVFLARLADCARDDGSAIPIAAERLAQDCRMSVCTVRRYIAKWRAQGVLIAARAGVAGRPTQYALNVSELEAMSTRAREAKELTTDQPRWLGSTGAKSAARSPKETNGRAQ